VSSVALVHDYLLVMRGAERSFAALAECYPDAPIYTLLYDEEGTARQFAHRDVRTSYLQRLGASQRTFRRRLPLFPRAVERLPVRDYELVISNTSAFAHGVRAGQEAFHFSYCHSPFRYAWHERERAMAEVPAPLRPALRRTFRRFRDWDRRAAHRVTAYAANSELTAERMSRFWDRKPEAVIHPPVDVHRFSTAPVEDFFLVVTELVRHKRVEVALEAARRARVPVKVVGTGPELTALREGFGGTTEFLGRVSDQELSELYARARATLVPSIEEFGIVAVEGMAAGRPVVAAAAGGALETVVDGETGILLPPDDVEQWVDTLRQIDFEAFRPEKARRRAELFSVDAFKRRFVEEVERVMRTHRELSERAPQR
jgi:glycosyltransferase involved in cell wall biosynthesis